jgi:hypothetical protein
LELFVDAVAAVPGGGQVGGLGEGLAEAGFGGADFGPGAVDIGEGLGFAGFEAREAAFQAGDEADGLEFGEVGGVRAVERETEADLAEWLAGGECEGEAAEFSGAEDALAGAELLAASWARAAKRWRPATARLS